MDTVLVTGAAGFIGSNVARRLVARGVRVRALHLPGENLANLAGLDVDLLPGDVLDEGAMLAAARGCRWVFHLAAVYALWMRDPGRMRAVNVEGTQSVLRAADKAGVERAVHTSSIAVYGGQGRGVVASEQSPFRLGETGDAYSISKWQAHAVALDFARRGVPVVIAAPTGPIGPGDIGPTPTGRLLLSAVRNPLPVVVDTAANLVDVRDCAEGHVLAATGGRIGESYLLGGANVAAAELARMALAIAGRKKPVIEAPMPLAMGAAYGMVAWSLLSGRSPLFTPASLRIAARGLEARADKAAAELGFSCRPIEQSVRDALAWFAEKGSFRPGA